jgi:hypothetical protein
MRYLPTQVGKNFSALKVIGRRLTADEFAPLRSSNDEVMPLCLAICFWSPFVENARESLSRIERVIDNHPSARLAVVLPYIRQEALSPEQRDKQAGEIEKARDRLTRDAQRPVLLLDSRTPVIQRLGIGVLPELALLDRQLTVQEIFVGVDSWRLKALGARLQELEAASTADASLSLAPVKYAPASKVPVRRSRFVLGRWRHFRSRPWR